jgi:hypothetical protein
LVYGHRLATIVGPGDPPAMLDKATPTTLNGPPKGAVWVPLATLADSQLLAYSSLDFSACDQLLGRYPELRSVYG